MFVVEFDGEVRALVDRKVSLVFPTFNQWALLMYLLGTVRSPRRSRRDPC
jgi:hypothetical protein